LVLEKFNRNSVALEIVGSVGPQRRSSTYWSKVAPWNCQSLRSVPMFDQRYESYLKTPGAGPSMLVVLQVLWSPTKQRVVGYQGGEICRRRHPLNPELSSIGHQGESEPGEYKD
jgi:hypothetical protein